VPFISQIATFPDVSFHKRSPLASALKSPGAGDAPSGWHIGKRTKLFPFNHGGAIHLPNGHVCHWYPARAGRPLPSAVENRAGPTIDHWPGDVRDERAVLIENRGAVSFPKSTVLPELSRHAMSLKPSPLKLCVVRRLNWKTVPHPLLFVHALGNGAGR